MHAKICTHTYPDNAIYSFSASSSHPFPLGWDNSLDLHQQVTSSALINLDFKVTQPDSLPVTPGLFETSERVYDVQVVFFWQLNIASEGAQRHHGGQMKGMISFSTDLFWSTRFCKSALLSNKVHSSTASFQLRCNGQTVQQYYHRNNGVGSGALNHTDVLILTQRHDVLAWKIKLDLEQNGKTWILLRLTNPDVWRRRQYSRRYVNPGGFPFSTG